MNRLNHVRFWGLLFLCCGGFAQADLGVKRVLLVPLDDRPATTQFAQMIGDLANVSVDTPPAEYLGRFTQPGRPERILDWMGQHMGDYDALVLDMDMVAYGGLIASRTDRTSYNLAVKRLRALVEIRRKFPNVRVLAFSAVMRLAPTATKESKSWRMDMARLAELVEANKINPDAKTENSIKTLKKRIPQAEVDRYYAVRERDAKIQQELARLTAQGVFDFIAYGQDDAKPIGPHVAETKRLQQMAANLKISGKVLFASGIDQLASVLVSRVLVRSESFVPKIRVVYADQAGRQKIAFYESETIDSSLKDQILGSGAAFAGPNESFDYSLYVNTPDPKAYALDAFLRSMKSEVDQGFPVAVADANLNSGGVADPRLFEAVTSQGRSSRILAYAGWNTAGNTMGTTIPAANVYMLSRRSGVDPLRREVALRTFILHRLVNDFEYHKYVRPEAYAMIDKLPHASREETYGSELEQVSKLVRKDLGERLEKRFDEQLLGTKFFAGADEYEIKSLTNVSIDLPWPRAYEVKLKFSIDVEAVAQPTVDLSKIPILPLGGGGLP